VKTNDLPFLNAKNELVLERKRTQIKAKKVAKKPTHYAGLTPKG
jgi:hypothetical protein